MKDDKLVIEQNTPAKITTVEALPITPAITEAKVVAAAHASSEDSLRSEGQRHVNLMWETTQAKIAIAVVYAVLVVASLLSMTAMLPWATEKQVALAITAFMLLSSLSTLVIGFYYGRTNHTRTGGVGGDQIGR